MRKRIMKSLIGITAAMLLLMGCGNGNTDGEDADVIGETAVSEGIETETSKTNGKKYPPIPESPKKVGVLMPNRVSERWVNDGANMQTKLKELGYDVILRYADDDIELQNAQIEDMIAKGVDCLVVASIDGGSCKEIDSLIKEAGIPIIAYDRLLMDIDSVFYYASFDNRQVGRIVGNYIAEEKQLEKASLENETYTIELFMGSPDDNNAPLFYEGIMEVLQPYFDNGTLIAKSGNISFEDTCILRYSMETAAQTCETYLELYYADEPLDIVCSIYDGYSQAVVPVLKDAGYTVGEDWPLITGQDAEIETVNNIIDGYQTMSVFKDTRILAEKCTAMVQAVLEGSTPEINDTEQYHNNVVNVPAYLCTPVAVDNENYKELIMDSGYYTEEQLAE